MGKDGYAVEKGQGEGYRRTPTDPISTSDTTTHVNGLLYEVKLFKCCVCGMLVGPATTTVGSATERVLMHLRCHFAPPCAANPSPPEDALPPYLVPPEVECAPVHELDEPCTWWTGHESIATAQALPYPNQARLVLSSTAGWVCSRPAASSSRS